MDKRKYDIVCDGDSWTFGSELADPVLAEKFGGPTIHPGVYDFFQENDGYRIPKIWSTFLENELDANCYNISWPADDNGTILNRTIDYVTRNYLIPKKDTSNLIVIVGWSSPERKSFWYKDEKIDYHYRLAPNVPHFNSKGQEDFWKLYVEYFWNKEEYIPRFIMNVLQLQTFCEANKIKWLCYNSFYQVGDRNVQDWRDLSIKDELEGMATLRYNQMTSDIVRTPVDMNYKNTWNLISPINFYKKDEKNNTFRTFIMNNCDNPFVGWHPSEEGHKVWAKELSRYIKENIL